MKSFVKTILFAVFVLVLVSGFSWPTLAFDYGQRKAVDAAGENIPTVFGGVAGEGGITRMIGTIVNAGLGLLGIVFFALLLYGGFRWMTAMGKAETVTKAKDILEAAAIGIVIVFLSYALVNYVLKGLGGGEAGRIADAVDISEWISCDGDGENMVRKDADSPCLTKCAAKYPGGLSKCGPPAGCIGTIERNLCPGGAGNVCCVVKRFE